MIFGGAIVVYCCSDMGQTNIPCGENERVLLLILRAYILGSRDADLLFL
jgi:hypothetical protein